MTKKEIAWLLIRLAGLWLLWRAVEGAFTLIASYVQVSQNGELLARSAGVFWQMTLLLVGQLALGLYCVFRGNILFQILDSENEELGQEQISIVDLHK